ncbi:MAG TPA: thioesterase family protein [Gemmatimonadales bacterium]|jgi:acyl-CoA thioester hydrolase
MRSFELPVVVAPEDIDGLGHVNNVVYLRWMQQAAGAHWEAATTPEQRVAVSWVVIRHEIDYKAPAFAGERLVVRTRVGAATAATWERLSEVRRVAGDALLARCRSVYVALDPSTGRPQRLKPDLMEPLTRP